MKIIKAAAFTLFVFGLLGWLYIVLNSAIHPWTLAMPLTHFVPFPREDTAGGISFVVSLVSFFIWSLVKDEK